MNREFITEQGIWAEVRTDLAGIAARPALLLDRDGVIVEEVGYLYRAEDVRLIPGAAETIAAANRAGVPVVIVTNQAGIGRGYYGWEDFAQVQSRLLADLVRGGAWVDMVLACPFHAEGRGAFAIDDHPARKPNPGMILAAAEALPIDLGRSWIVGDQASDLEAGRRANLAGAIHVASGHGEAERPRNSAGENGENGEFTVLTADTIAQVPALVPALAPAPERAARVA